jgi:histidyl-tRNA synthetase
MKIETPKGVRDFPPEQKILRQKIADNLRSIFEVYGFQPLETPILELYETLASKYAGGSEILKETYKLTDQGERKLALRYDLTVPLARFVAMNPQLKMPFKRYQIGPVFRDGPIKVGRYREFYQCDVDIVGSFNMAADAEILRIVLLAFDKLGIDVQIRLNNRKVLDSLMEYAKISAKDREAAILSLDKLEKLGKDYVLKELKDKGIKDSSIKLLLPIVSKGTNNEVLNTLKEIIPKCEGIKEIEEVLKLTGSKKIIFDVALARGLAYYTGNIFEVYSSNKKFKSSIAAGGRYDRMINDFIGRSGYPAVGIAFGLDIIYEILKEKETQKSLTKVYIIPIKTLLESFNIAEKLRKAGINTDMDLNDRSISKNLDYANKMQIPYVIFVGKQELEKDVVKLRDMKSGKEELLKVEDVIDKLAI